MSFIGHNQKPAPKLKHAKMSAADLIIAYEQCIEVGQFILIFASVPKCVNETLATLQKSLGQAIFLYIYLEV